jgi:hypothetical protein
MAEVRLSIAEAEAIVAQLRRVATTAGAGLTIDTAALDRTADALADLAFQATEGGDRGV